MRTNSTVFRFRVRKILMGFLMLKTMLRENVSRDSKMSLFLLSAVPGVRKTTIFFRYLCFYFTLTRKSLLLLKMINLLNWIIFIAQFFSQKTNFLHLLTLIWGTFIIRICFFQYCFEAKNRALWDPEAIPWGKVQNAVILVFISVTPLWFLNLDSGFSGERKILVWLDNLIATMEMFNKWKILTSKAPESK